MMLLHTLFIVSANQFTRAASPWNHEGWSDRSMHDESKSCEIQHGALVPVYESYNGYTGLDEIFRSTHEDQSDQLALGRDDVLEPLPFEEESTCGSPLTDRADSIVALSDNFPSNLDEAKTLLTSKEDEVYFDQLSQLSSDHWYQREIDSEKKKVVVDRLRRYLGYDESIKSTKSIRRLLTRKMNSIWASLVLNSNPDSNSNSIESRDGLLHRIALFLLPSHVKNAAYTLIHHDRVPPGVACYMVKQAYLDDTMSGAQMEHLRQHVLQRWENCKNAVVTMMHV